MAHDESKIADGDQATASPGGPAIAAVPPAADEPKQVKTLEQRYIELLEDKIARLEAESSVKKEGATRKTDAKTENDVKTDGTNGTKPSSEDASKDKDGAKGESNSAAKKSDKKTRVRYLRRKLDEFSDYKDEEVDAPNFTTEENVDESKNEYAIAWRASKPTDGEKSTRELLIEAPKLRAALKEVLSDYPYLSFDTNEVVISPPFADIYHNQQQLKACAKKADEQTKADIELLLAEVEKVQETERKDAETLAKDGKVTFDLLWTLFHPGCLVVQKSFLGQEHVQIVAPFDSPIPNSRWGSNDTVPTYYFNLWSVDYDGEDFRVMENDVSIKSFKGQKEILDLDVYPLTRWKSKDGSETWEGLKERLIKRGQKFEELCTLKTEHRFRQYEGLVKKEGKADMVSSTVDVANDDDSRSTTSTFRKRAKVKPQEGTEKLDELSFVMVDHFAYLTFGQKPLNLGSRVVNHSPCTCMTCSNVRKKNIGELPETEKQKKKGLTAEQHLLCSPRVYGFAMRLKEWVQMLVTNVKEISQDDKDSAWRKLELPEKSKKLLKTLVTQHSKDDAVLQDLIPGKGNGLIVLLHGPPGVGKTLTAESLAILSGKPLYSVSMSDVGTSAEVVEENLVRVFELATHWKALLLFDEADVFLGSRSMENLQRNSLVSVLIRILEYFEGILFLTSNRVKTFDEAFQSRIHIAIQYKELSESQRIAIWNTWIRKAEEQDDIADESEFKEELQLGGDVAKAELNGRQIRNVFRSAMAVAKARGIGQKMKYKDLAQVLGSTVEFQMFMGQSKALAEKQGIR